MKRSINLFVCTCALVAAMAALAMLPACTPPSSSDASSEATPDAAASESTQESNADSELIVDVNDTPLSSGSSSASSASMASSASASASSASADAYVEDSPLAKQLKEDITPIVDASGMTVGVCAIDLASNSRASIEGDKPMVSASMIKLPIAACLFEKVKAGELSLDDTYVIQDHDIVGGTGSLGGRGAGAETTYTEMLEMMIAESDNTATNIIIDTLGMDAINKTAKDLKLKSTELNRMMMDYDAIAAGTENYISANDAAKILKLAYEGKLVDAESSKLLVSALEAQQDGSGILAGLPGGTVFAHKTGTLGNAQHDGGIAEVGDGHDFVLVVLCGGDGFSQDGAFSAMAEIGRVTYADIVE